jgi:general secretion pathway protein L
MPLLATGPIRSFLVEGSLAPFWRPALPLFRSLWSWWQRQFFDLFENAIGRWLLGPQRRTLYLRQSAGTVELRMSGDGTAPETIERYSSYSAETLNGFLAAKGLSRQDIDLIVLVPIEKFFGRILHLPEQTLSDLDKVIAKDLARKTTFKPNEIRDGYEVEREPGGSKITVRHWIIRRSFVEQALAELHLDPTDVARIESFGSAIRPSIVLNPREVSQRPWYWNATRLLALGSLVLALATFGLATWRKQVTLTELTARIDASRAKAQSVRAQLDDLDKRQSAVMRVRGDKISRSNLSEIWEKVTATLPTDSWLIELQLTQSEASGREGQTLRLTGFSASAAELVTLFDNAGSFEDAVLTAPVSVDPIEKRERFALQMKVRNPPIEKVGQK